MVLAAATFGPGPVPVYNCPEAHATHPAVVPEDRPARVAAERSTGPDAMGLDLHLVEVGLDATDADLVEQMRHMEAHRQAGFRRVGCVLRGYGDDPRALWQIPEGVEFCKKLVRIGFIAGLDVSFTVPERVPLPVPVAPWGSLDIWLIAKGHMKGGAVEITRPLLDQFTRDLKYLNTVAED